PRQPSQRSADDATRHHSGRCALRSLGVLFVRELLRADVFRKQHRDIGVPKSGSLQFIYGIFHLTPRRINSKNCSVRHVRSFYLFFSATVNSLFTAVTPAIALAFASTAAFSSSLL